MAIKAAFSLVGTAILVAVATPHSTDARVELGFQGGPNLGLVSYDAASPVWNPQWNVGFSAGAFAKAGLPGRLSLVPEIRYVQVKSRVNFDPPFRGHMDLTHEYLSMPVGLRFSVVRNMLFLDAGPDVLMLLSARSRGEVWNPGFAITTDLTREITEDMESQVLAIFGGVVFDASSVGLPVEVRVRYTTGVTGAAKEDKWWSNWKTQELAAALAFKAGVP
jgi:hypothetical protein